MLRIACFGDSNTYGFDPRMGGYGRYPASVRWTGRLNALPDVSVRNLGMNGASIPASANYVAEIYDAEKPDVITIMFGSNDVLEKVSYAEQIDRMTEPGQVAVSVAAAMDRFLTDVKSRLADRGNPEIILISPPAMTRGTWTDAAIVDEMKRLAPLYDEIADRHDVRFLDAAAWPLELCFDGVHLTEEGHRVFCARMSAALGLEV